ncbi:membrane protein [Mycobacterium phage Guanica15]|uniref:Membrane protein n=1 Tax=Mycobacterium phage Yunkel11 TaxID=2599886 RepID=A0A5J6TFB4_9CAUD|nr:membrane protein [Mycobacterium phage Yunkel11]QFG08437.1 membrane protein [Mycobacterium phage Yunkel11]QFG09237.1 membrane protein [Mycobacterium phage Efra2]QFG11661.1 membrane protein [Mycobacterium phage Guanica15]
MSNKILTHKRRISPDQRPGERLGAVVGVFLLHLAMTIVGAAAGAAWVGLYLGAPW